MSVARPPLLEVSDNQSLGAHGARVPFIHPAISKFMPGQAFKDMIATVRTTVATGIAAVFTRLGLDLDRELADGHLRDLASHPHAAGNYLWIDVEQSPPVDVTLTLTKRLTEEFPGIGVRLVKGAYHEPAQLRWTPAGALVRVLIGYGDYWFPWDLRRLAERPANVWLVAKNLVG